MADLRSLIPLRVSKQDPASTNGRTGRLEADGVSLNGQLVASSRTGAALVWQPRLCSNAAALIAGLSGRIVYRESSPPSVARSTPTPPQRALAAAVVMRANNAAVGPTPPAVSTVPANGRRSMHLRTGDAIPCEVSRIDEKGVTFTTPLSNATFVAHDKIKSIELIPSTNPLRLEAAKRDRLLTLPRLQKDSPPTHLICSKNGDFLRGRIVDMDDKRLVIEVRLESKEIPRERIAQIIWLHADELAEQKPPPAAEATAETRAQALHADGHRLTFVVTKADNKSIFGASSVLGACQATLADVNQLLFGDMIEESAARLAYNAWKLHHAAEPKFAAADAGWAPSRTESPLVGQPAHAFKVDLLDGAAFRLAEHKGRIVVLDFWASWCGPCMQSLPLIDGVAREFADRGVDLVAVNMEESADQVKSTLERHKLTMPVVIDRDGVVAAKYSVSAIPQTVVTDRDRKVVRVYVGGGKAAAEALRKSL